ncbi:MAG TPA: hypothetical protein VNH84_07260 [Candidatus Saccharimonadales bacterium]|jgi:hypothetical protein|nr:hypothetical protein [Candidatus Saccharimonadales bacterium]
MNVALWLLALQGAIGAFDTLYYHEWRARLPMRGPAAAPELRLHAGRDFLYGILFCTLAWLQWNGAWALVLAAVLVAEIVLTLWDFVVEIAVRRSLGDVYAGERVTHAVMGILYGSMVGYLVPVLAKAWTLRSGLVAAPAPVPDLLRWTLTVMGAGVVLSGLRDLYAALGLPGGGWPWGSRLRGLITEPSQPDPGPRRSRG